jgi:hypothetical protein
LIAELKVASDALTATPEPTLVVPNP